ncbi:hypothetical protein DCC79_13015 [bacterium]|nr:MAG: hypothetical protein DCC79_13015 [bacterium]
MPPTARLATFAAAAIGLGVTLLGPVTAERGAAMSARPAPAPVAGPGRAPAAPVDQVPACTANLDKTAAPREVKLGQVVTVTLKVDGTCPSKDQPADVILAIDHSSSMGTDNKLQAAQSAAVAFVNHMDPALVRIGLVSVTGVATRIQDLTTDKAALVAAINGLGLERGTNIVDGLDVSRRALSGANVRPGANKVIIFLTDGRHRVNNPPIGDLDAVIAAVRTAGIDVYSIALGNDADTAVLRRMATGAAHFFHSPTTAELEGIYLQIAGRIQAQVLYKTTVLTDVVPANMDYVAGSAAPVAPTVSPDGRTLTWRIDNAKAPGYTLTYQLRPRQAGTWPTNVRADLVFEDGFGNRGQKTFPVPTVKVTEEVPVPQPGGCVCRDALRGVPEAVIADALARPDRYHGWRYLLDPNKPPSPANPPRECLSIMNRNIPYHPLWNTVEWHVGCP